MKPSGPRKTRAAFIAALLVASTFCGWGNATAQEVLYKDEDPGTPGRQEGNGTWDLVSNTWLTPASTNATWQQGATAVFGSGVYADTTHYVNVTDPITLSGLTFTNGGMHVLTSTAGSLSFPTSVVVRADRDAELGVAIQGDGFTKTGDGTLTLSAANAYLGQTTIDAGTLRTAHGGALGVPTAGTVINAGGTLDINGQNLGTELVTLRGGALINDGVQQIYAVTTVSVTADSIIGGSANWQIRDSSGSATSQKAWLTVANGVTLTKIDTNWVYLTHGNLLNNGQIVISEGDFLLTWMGSTGGAGAFTVNSDGALYLYSGTSYGLTINNLPVLLNGGVLGSYAGTAGSVQNGDITLVADSFLEGNEDWTVNGSISGSADLTLRGSGGITKLRAANTYSGRTIIDGGHVDSTDEASLGPNPPTFAADHLTLHNDAVLLATSADLVIDDVNRGITIGDGGGRFSVWDGHTLTVSTPITATGQLITQGRGTSVLAPGADFTSTSQLLVNAGTLRLSGVNVSLGTGTHRVAYGNETGVRLEVGTGATLTTAPDSIFEVGHHRTGSGSTGGILHNSGGTIVINGLVRLGWRNPSGNAYGSLWCYGGVTTVAGYIYTANAREYSVITLDDGTLETAGIRHAGHAAANGRRILFDGGLLRALAGDSDKSFLPSISEYPGFDENLKAYVRDGGAIIDSQGYTITCNVALLNDGTGGLTKLGSGTLILTRGDTYIGPTIVSNGTLRVNGVQSGGGAYTVSSNATLTGTGTIPSAVTVDAAGRIGQVDTPTPGTLTVSSLNLTAESRLLCAPNNLTPSIQVAHSFAPTTPTFVDLVQPHLLTPGTHTLIKYTTLDSDGFGALQFNYEGSRLAVELSNNVANTSIDLVVTDLSPATNLIWRGNESVAWDTDNTTNWFTLAGGQPITFVSRDNVTFDDRADLYTVNVAEPVAPASITVNNLLNNYTIGGDPIVGATGLTKTGSRTLTLTGNNTFSGTSVIDNGTLQLGDGGTGGSLGTGDVVNHDDFVFNRADSFTVPNAISGGGTLTKQGAGTTTVSGANSYTGSTLVLEGTLAIGNADALGGTDAIRVAPAGQVEINGAQQVGRQHQYIINGDGPDGRGAIVNTGDDVFGHSGVFHLTLADDATVGTFGTGDQGGRFDIGYNVGGTFDGGGYTLTKAGPGRLAIRVMTTNLAETIVNGGTLLSESFDNTFGARATVNPGARLAAFGALSNNCEIVLNAGTLVSEGNAPPLWTGPITVNDACTLTTQGDGSAGSMTLTGVISGPGSVTIAGPRTVTFGGTMANTYAGTTYVDNAGSALLLEKPDGVAAVPGHLHIGLNGSHRAYVFLGASEQIPDSSSITFHGSLEKWGYLELRGHDETVSAISSLDYGVIENTENESGITDSGTLTVSNELDCTFNGHIRDRLGGSSTGLFKLAKTGSGTLTLGRAYTHSKVSHTGQTTVNNGTLALVDLYYITTSDLHFSSPITINSNGSLLVSSKAPLDGWLYEPALTGAGTLIKEGGGCFQFDGASPAAFEGHFVVREGVLGSAEGTQQTDWAGCTADATINSGAALDLRADHIWIDALGGEGEVWNSETGTNILTLGVADGSGTFGGVIRGAGGGPPDTPDAGLITLLKDGTETQVLSSANTYGGGTIVSNGTLRVMNSTGSATGPGAARVLSGATLDGTGIASLVEVENGGRLGAGTSMGKIDVSGTLEGNARLVVEINDFSGAPGQDPGWDWVDASGAVTLAGGGRTPVIVELHSLDGAVPGGAANFDPNGSYVLKVLTAAGGLSGFSDQSVIVNTDSFSNTRTHGFELWADDNNMYLIYNAEDLPVWTWDAVPGVGVADDGSGTWDTTEDDWWGGFSNRVWNNAGSQAAAFGVGTEGSYTVTVDAAGIAAHDISFNTGPHYTIAGPGTLTLADTPTVRTDGDALISAVVTGDFQKAGSAMLTLSAEAQSRVTVTEGTLRIGEGGPGGLLTGDIENNATLALHRSDDVTFSNWVSGAGSLVKLGPNRVVLTGINTYTGGTVIAAGTLQIGDGTFGGTLGAGTVMNDGRLVFNRPDVYFMDDAISGRGSITQLGTGLLVLTRTNTFGGDVLIANGSLQLVRATCLNPNVTMRIAQGAYCELQFVGTQPVYRLYLDGILQPPGLYGPATHPGWFIGELGGYLQVGWDQEGGWLEVR